MGGNEAIERLLNVFRIAGAIGFTCGMVLALVHSVKLCEKREVSFWIHFRGWWWRVPLAFLLIMLASFPLGAVLLALAVGVGMSAGTSSNGGFGLVVPILVFAGLSTVTAFFLLKRGNAAPNQPAANQRTS